MGAYDDSVNKELHLYFMTQEIEVIPQYNYYDHITNDRIVSESLSFTMGILDEYDFRLGSYVIPELQVDILYDGTRYRNTFVRVWINEKPTTSNPSPQKNGIIFGKVYKEQLSGTRDILTLTIRNVFYEALNKEISYNDLFFTEIDTGYIYYSATPVGIYQNLLLYTYGYALGYQDAREIMDIDIDNQLDNFRNNYSDICNNIIMYRLNDDDDIKLTLAEAWRYFCEFLGTHIYIPQPNYIGYNVQSTYVRTLLSSGNFDIYIDMLRIDDTADLLYPSQTLYPNNNLLPLGIIDTEGISPVHYLPYYINCQYDEFVSTSYEAIYFRYDNIEFITADTPATEYKTVYKIENNPLFYNMNENNCMFVIQKVYEYLKIKKYIYAKLDCIFNPTIRPGDNLIIETSRNNILVIPVLSCNVYGINSLQATITAFAESKE